MTEKYEPDTRFVERLEWQLSSEYRRGDRLKSPPKIAVSRRMAAVAVMIGVLLTGVAVSKAADYFKDSWRKKIEIARAETEVTLKKARYDSTREIAASVEEQVTNGLSLFVTDFEHQGGTGFEILVGPGDDFFEDVEAVRSAV